MDSQTNTKSAGEAGKTKSKSKEAVNKKNVPAPRRHKQKMPGLGNKQEQGKAEPRQEIELISDTVTKGKNGEANITVEWYWQWVDGSHPCGWRIGTLEGHELDVTVAIRNYNKHLTGTTRVDTGLAPCTVQMVGSKGDVSITDLSSGEKRVVSFGVYLLPGPFGKLWKWLKKMFVGRD